MDMSRSPSFSQLAQSQQTEAMRAWEAQQAMQNGALSAWEDNLGVENGEASSTGAAWERELEEQEGMDMQMSPAARPPVPHAQDVSPPPAPGHQLPAEPPRDAVSTLGVCMLLNFMLAPPEAEEPRQLRAFWADATAPAPRIGLPQLHDFMFRLFALCMFTPECVVLAFMLIIRVMSYHPHLRVTSRNCKRLILCAVMIAQKYWDDTPLRNIDFSVAWGRVCPHEKPVPIDRVNAMECIFLGALGFDLYVPEAKYNACLDELATVVRTHDRDDAETLLMLQKHAAFLAGPDAKRFPWVARPVPRIRR